MDRLSFPHRADNAPYLAALVANSWMRSARAVTAPPETGASIPDMTMRGSRGSSNGATMARISACRVVGCGDVSPSENVSACARASAARRSRAEFDHLARRHGRARAESDDASCQGEQILHPMAHFPQQQLLPLARLLQFADVARDRRGADDPTVRVTDRRGGERNVEEASILAPPHRLELADAFAASDRVEHGQLLVAPVDRNDDRRQIADRFLRPITEQPFGSRVPAQNDAVDRLRKDRIVRRFDDRRIVAGRAIFVAQNRGRGASSDRVSRLNNWRCAPVKIAISGKELGNLIERMGRLQCRDTREG